MLMLQCLDRRMVGVRGLSREENQLNFLETGPDSVSLCFFRLSNQPFEAPDLVQVDFYTLETCNSIINPSATSVSPSASSLVFGIKSECVLWLWGLYVWHPGPPPHPNHDWLISAFSAALMSQWMCSAEACAALFMARLCKLKDQTLRIWGIVYFDCCSTQTCITPLSLLPPDLAGAPSRYLF